MKMIAAVLIIILAACSSAAAPAPTNVPSQPESASVPAEAAASRPAWQTIPLTNARSGETFTLADFAGRTVYVEPMATWCTNCRAQMHRVVPVYEELRSDSSYAFVSLSVGENVSDADLAAYADREGFNWIFAVAPPEMLAELSSAFGGAALTPPSTPHFIIWPDGTDSGLKTGAESTDELRAALTGD